MLKCLIPYNTINSSRIRDMERKKELQKYRKKIRVTSTLILIVEKIVQSPMPLRTGNIFLNIHLP
jgi:hypothetical protein